MNYIIMLIGGMLGILLYSLRKVKGIRKRMRKNITYADYTWKQVFEFYWVNDWISIATSFLVVLIAMFIISGTLNIPQDEPLKITELNYWLMKLINAIRVGFIVIGFMGNSIVDVFAGRTEGLLDQIAKTGSSTPDDFTPPVSSTQKN